MTKQIRAALLLFGLTIVICCVAYPAVLWAIGQTVFHDKAEGSLIRAKGSDGVDRVVGSRLIAQPFTNDEYFWPRPSAASYNGAAAGGSNYGANNPKLRDRAAQQLGSMVKFKAGSASAGTGPEPRTPQQDIEAWFAANADRLKDWANEYSVGTAGWAKTDYDSAKDKYGLQGDFITAWAKDHPDIVDDWKKANPTKTDEPKPEDLATNFFVSYAAAKPGKWPGVVEDEKTKEKKISPVSSDSAISANLFDMWLQDPVNAAKVADLEPVPADMVTASGSGLDPNITLRNALSVYQLDRVAEKRTPKGGDVEKTKKAIGDFVRKLSFTPLSGVAGEPLVNVLEINVELDAKWPLPAVEPTPPVAVAPMPPMPVESVRPVAPKIDPAIARRDRLQSLVAQGDQAAVDELIKWTETEPAADAWAAIAQVRLRMGQFRTAATAFRESASRLTAGSPEHAAAETAARDAARWAGLERRLPEILAGTAKPMSATAWADFGEVCRCTNRFAAASRFFAKATEGEPKYARLAAVYAALAGFNHGTDAKDLTDNERAQLRREALAAFCAHRDWANEAELAQLKTDKLLNSLPSEERAEWKSLMSIEVMR
jgi:K+-transporting ATPase ATPase C chain